MIEPHVDVDQSMLYRVPKFRKNDVIDLELADTNSRITFNPLNVPPGVLNSFQKVFGLDESQAPRLFHIFRNCLMSLLELPVATLLTVQRMLVAPLTRKSVVGRVSSPVIRCFWQG